ncbi:uncharacterized protein MONBRDRAFT_33679 [Monosiga brevicollis MX1]|uniref:PH domain-containing protein n=1 Tax=Monosiga brevicollis TaxID=81824 RepID=A9V6I9_MONBE|nr:uncharacterized protein MONBRDRAFT_33679 [Monosiga brevicollis MX1]EDQ86814.1 predicted protein [Monosiga brevicollis MX1]|eukprot:XP_001748359.1 hypothetical protein [Monosiga brevicollis MX1]
MTEREVDALIGAAVQAALANDGTVLQATSQLVGLFKDLCTGHTEAMQTDARKALTTVVGNARRVAAAEADPLARCLALGEFGLSCTALADAGKALVEAAASTAAPAATPAAEPGVQEQALEDIDDVQGDEPELYNNFSGNAMAMGIEEEEDDDDDFATADDETATARLAVASALPPLEDEIQDVVDIILHDAEELFGAIERWDVADVVCITTGVIRALPTLLQEADKIDSDDVAQARQNVVESCGVMTGLARTVARNPDGAYLTPQLSDALSDLTTDINGFVVALKRHRYLGTQDEISSEVLIQRCEGILLTKQQPSPYSDAPNPEKLQRVTNLSQKAAMHALSQLSGCLLSDDPTVKELAALLDQIVTHICHLLDASDRLSHGVNLPPRAHAFETCHLIVRALLPVCKPVPPGGNGPEVGAALTTLRSNMPVLLEAIKRLGDECDRLLEQAQAKPPPLPQRFEPTSAGITTIGVTCRLCSDNFINTKGEPLRLGDATQVTLFEDATIQQLMVSLTQNIRIPVTDLAVLSAEQVLPGDLAVADALKQSELYVYNKNDKHDLQNEVALIKQRQLAKALRTNKMSSSTNIKRSETKRAFSELKGRSDEETARLQLMSLVKDGRLTVDQAVSASTIANSAAMQLSLKASHALDMPANKRPAPGIPPAPGINTASDEDSMSMAAFAATSTRRKFSRSPSPSGGAPKLFMEGFLGKEGGTYRTWKTRWFVLTDVELTYFRSPSVKDPLGVIPLDVSLCCSPEPDRSGHGNCFALKPKQQTERVFYLSAATEAQRRAWMRCIDQLIPGRQPYVSQVKAVKTCIQHLQESGIAKEDVFRVPGNAGQVQKLVEAMQTKLELPADLLGNPHTLVSFIKAVFKNRLLGPFLSDEEQQLLSKALQESASDEATQVSSVRHALELMHPLEADLVLALGELLVKVDAHQAVTKCSSEDLSRSFGPLLFPSAEESQACRAIFLLQAHLEDMRSQDSDA